jgi:hypothetical protein
VAPIAIVVAVLAVVWSLNRGRGLSRELAAEKERHALELAGVNVAHQVERDAIMQDLMGEAAASASLAEELARIQAAAPGAKPIGVAHGGTGRIRVGPAAGGSVTPSPPAEDPGTSPSVPASCPPCRLVAGDELEIRVSGAALETAAGNVAVAAAASTWRYPAGGGAPELLVEGPLKLDVKIPERAGGPGWGFGPMVAGFAGPNGGGWLVGAVAATPSVRLLFGVEGSLVAGGGVGPNGVGGGFLSAVLR